MTARTWESCANAIDKSVPIFHPWIELEWRAPRPPLSSKPDCDIGCTIVGEFLSKDWKWPHGQFRGVDIEEANSIVWLIAFAIGAEWARVTSSSIVSVNLLTDGNNLRQAVDAKFRFGGKERIVTVGGFGVARLGREAAIDLAKRALAAYGNQLSNQARDKLTGVQPSKLSVAAAPEWYDSMREEIEEKAPGLFG